MMEMIGHVMRFSLFMVIYTVFLFSANEAARRYSRLTFYGFLLALITVPLWYSNLGSWFRWGKTLAVIIPLIALLGMGKLAYLKEKAQGLWALFRRPGLHRILWVVLVINILMAVLKDGQGANWFNAIAGLIVAITAPQPSQGRWRITATDKSKTDYLAKASWQWCALYTIWNITFVYGENPGFVASSACLLAAPMIYCVLKRSDLWMHARIVTLGIHLLIRANYDIFGLVIESSRWANPTVLTGAGVVNLSLGVVFLVWWFFSMKRKPEPAANGEGPLEV